MIHHDFEGEFWNTDPNSSSITRLHFVDRARVAAWGSCFPEDCPWGETDLHVLREAGIQSGGLHAFATWGGDSEPVHCLMTLVDDVLTIVQIAIRSDIPSYKLTETFHKDDVRSAEAKDPDPLRKFKHMWDGSEPGWKLIQYSHQVFLVEFNFDESGPTRAEFPAVVEYCGLLPGESDDQMWARLRGCSGVGIARPFGPKAMERLRGLQRQHNLNLTVCTIDPDDHLPVSPDGKFVGWMALLSYRRPVIERMLGAGIPVVSGRLE